MLLRSTFWTLLACQLISLVSGAVPGEAKTTVPFVTPPLVYAKSHSFRGLADGKVDNYQVSGHATSLIGVHDYLRLVPQYPLGYGAVFSSTPLESEQWIAEIAFRVHGSSLLGLGSEKDGEQRKVPKGGRGLAFWYTKAANPTEITISPSKKKVSDAPPVNPQLDKEGTDSKVSLFGNSEKFDGLGVIFDTSPHVPLFGRTDKRNYDGDLPGVTGAGVISGILDDGTGYWLEPKSRVMKESDEAAYLEKSIGECEAAFRNIQGLLWARVSYINSTIRVDLDLSPHTTLSKAGRDYAHNCFLLDGIKLPKGYHLGLSGLASGNAEPDAIDIYAIDIFEVLDLTNGQKAPSNTNEPPETKESQEPLEGTSDDGGSNLAHQIFLSQAKMMEAIDSLSGRIDNFLNVFAHSPGLVGGDTGKKSNEHSSDLEALFLGVEARLSGIDSKIDVLATLTGAHTNTEGSSDLRTQIQALKSDMHLMSSKLYTSHDQIITSLRAQAVQTDMLLKELKSEVEKSRTQRSGAPAWLVWFIAFMLVLGYVGKMARARNMSFEWVDSKKQF